MRLAILRAQNGIVSFTTYTMPHPAYMDDPEKSIYDVQPHHTVIGQAVDKVVEGKILRLALSMPPQHGKSELISRRLLAYYIGRYPWKNTMFATYNQEFAEVFGGQVRDIMTSPRFRQVFPNCRLASGSKAKDYLKTTDGGQMSFIGRGASGTGKPADLFVIDDPIKDAVEARSEATLKELWEWYSKVVFTRCHAGTAIIIVHTRWTEQDLIGRICDPTHPDYNEKRASKWTYLNLPALFEPGDEEIAAILGLSVGDALWSDRFPVSHLEEAKDLNPRGFYSLYQGKPTPDDGDYFTREMLVGYAPGDLPRNLRYFGASDHAVTEKQQNDPVCMGVAGVDEFDDIWILPDLVWERMETDRTVEEMIRLMRDYRPEMWWAENDVIGKAFGPFLRRQMREERVHCTIVPKTPSKDKRVRARNIQGMMSLRRVHFPKFAPWWSRAESEILKFDAAAHDDLVDFLGLIGMGLDVELGNKASKKRESNVVRVGSIEWIKARSKREIQLTRLERAANEMV